MTLVNSRSVGFFVARKFDDRHVTCQNAGGYPRILYAVVCYYFSIIIINIIVNQSIGAIIIIIKHLVCEIRYCPYKSFRHVCNYIKVML